MKKCFCLFLLNIQHNLVLKGLRDVFIKQNCVFKDKSEKKCNLPEKYHKSAFTNRRKKIMEMPLSRRTRRVVDPWRGCKWLSGC